MSRASPVLWAYLAASRLAGPLAGTLLRRRLRRGKEDPDRLGERLGRAGLPRPAGRLVWLHGASVGEAMSTLPLIAALQARADVEILVTTGTVTSAARIAPLLPDRARHQFVPVDTAIAVRRFLDHWRPDLCILIESELWPRLVRDTAARGVPMALVNARLSAKSVARWQKARDMISALLQSFGLILSQDHETLHRLRLFGVNPRFAGNLKALVEPPPCSPDALQTIQHRLGQRKVWLAASTHPGEEEQLLLAHRLIRARHPDALLILAPRHPERGDDLVTLLEAADETAARRSAGQEPDATTSVWLVDTLGEMGLWYRVAPVTFVGGSLVRMGGHTPFEPASLGTAIVHGPHVDNFAPAYASFGGSGGARGVQDGEELGTTVAHLLSMPAERSAMRQAAEAAHRALRPDVDAIAAQILALMEPVR